jgi:acetoin utilization deacetylase AcuC-like enzyme
VFSAGYNRQVLTVFAFEPAPEHVYSGHPEHPDRLSQLEPLLGSVAAEKIKGRAALPIEITAIHEAALVRSLEEACSQGGAIIDLAPTFVTRASFRAALCAAGATLECLSRVLNGDAGNAFSIVRPPGHHAEPARAMGFCLFNNAAIAAAFALAHGLQRVAIVDFDAHHGNGTQAAFLSDPRVAYLSMHEWGIYPGTGWYTDVSHARSRIVNVPLPAMSGNRIYKRAVDEIVEPFIRRFQPELLLVSAGFDAHWNDPITSLGLSTAGFHQVSRRLTELADDVCSGRIVFVLEGGYEPVNVANGCLAVFAALTHCPLVDPNDGSPHAEPDADERLAAIRALHGF